MSTSDPERAPARSIAEILARWPASCSGRCREPCRDRRRRRRDAAGVARRRSRAGAAAGAVPPMALRRARRRRPSRPGASRHARSGARCRGRRRRRPRSRRRCPSVAPRRSRGTAAGAASRTSPADGHAPRGHGRRSISSSTRARGRERSAPSFAPRPGRPRLRARRRSSTRRRSAATSRSSRSASTAGRWSGSTTPPRRRSRRAVIDRLSLLLRARELEHPPRRARARRARTDAYEARAREGAALPERAVDATRSSSCAAPPRASTSSPRAWGRRNVGEGRRDRHHLARAPRQHRPLAACSAPRRARGCASRRSTTAARSSSRSTRSCSARARGSCRFTQVSNALGTITPAREMVEMAHRHGARVLVDGAQAVSHMRVDVQALDCDFYVFSGHKVFAPDRHRRRSTARQDVLDAMPPWQGGGNMIAGRHLREDGLPAGAGALRGGHRQHRRRGGARRGARLPRRASACENVAALRARAARLRDRSVLQTVPGPAHHRHRAPRRRACSRSCSTASAPRTSARPSTRRASRCAPATTARSRSCAASASRARCARRSRSTTPARTSTRSSPPCAASRRAEGSKG